MLNYFVISSLVLRNLVNLITFYMMNCILRVLLI